MTQPLKERSIVDDQVHLPSDERVMTDSTVRLSEQTPIVKQSTENFTATKDYNEGQIFKSETLHQTRQGKIKESSILIADSQIDNGNPDEDATLKNKLAELYVKQGTEFVAT